MSELRDDCSKIRPLLEPYFEGVLPAPQERLVAEHLWRCPACAAEVEQIQRFTLALDSLPQAIPAQELLASISARITALPGPAERKRTLGWRRLGLAAAGAVALVALVSLGCSLALPALAVWAKPGLGFGLTTVHAFGNWTSANSRPLLSLAGAAKTIWPALRALGLAKAPVIAGYVTAQLMLLAAATWALRTRHRHAMVPSQVGTRR